MLQQLYFTAVWFHRRLCDANGDKNSADDCRRSSPSTEHPLQQNIMTEFIVVDTLSAYNAILGRPFLSGIRGVLSIYHNILKFSVGTGVREVRGDQQAARNCYAVSTNPAALAKQCAYVAGKPRQGTSKLSHYVLGNGKNQAVY